ncbi:MAG: hypothetical protein ACRC9N_02810 [Aeromonas sp.]
MIHQTAPSNRGLMLNTKLACGSVTQGTEVEIAQDPLIGENLGRYIL